MLEIKIGRDGIPSPSKVILGNRWENVDEKIHFDLPQEFDKYHKYVVSVIKTKSGYKTVTLPVKNNIFVVSSALTYQYGNWYMYLMCRAKPIDLENEEIDLGARNDEHVFISDPIIGIVNKNLIEKEQVDNIPMDTNLKIVYEELLVLKQNILDQIHESDSDRNSYEGIKNKPRINNVELIDNQTLYDLGYIPIHKISVKSYSALFLALKKIGLEIDEEDPSKFLFSFNDYKISDMFNDTEVTLDAVIIYTAEFYPIEETVTIDTPTFVITLDRSGIISYHSKPSVDSDKLDKYQGAENAGKVLVVGKDGNLEPVSASTLDLTNEDELDDMLKEVFG